MCLRELLGCHLSYLHSSRGSRLLGVQKWQLLLGAESAALGSHGGLWSGLGWAGTIPGGPCSRGTELVRGIPQSKWPLKLGVSGNFLFELYVPRVE